MKHEIVQKLNPKSQRYILIDKTDGIILLHKRTKGPYKNYPIIEKSEKRVGKTEEELGLIK